jgi:hypothetical protein
MSIIINLLLICVAVAEHDVIVNTISRQSWVSTLKMIQRVMPFFCPHLDMEVIGQG